MKLKRPSEEASLKDKEVRLPYLNQADRPRYTEKRPLLKNHSNHFDLRTSNAKMPSYNPESDRNLKFFFEKPQNKKLIERLNQNKTAISSKKLSHNANSISHKGRTVENQSDHNAVRTQKQPYYQNKGLRQISDSRKRINTSAVSSKQFIEYIENVRKKILSSQQSNPSVLESKSEQIEKSSGKQEKQGQQN